MSTTGGALLANDPHLGISMPSIWFINGLHCAPVTDACPYDVAGVTFPGLPGIILGHNARIAWGATNVEPDVAGPRRSRRRIRRTRTATWARMARHASLRHGPKGSLSKAATPSRLDVRETVHGPILNDVDERLKDAPLMALRWTSTSPDIGPDRTVESFLKLMTATDFDAFREALSGYVAPSQNFVYADVDGHIGYQLPGCDPRPVRPR